MMTEDANGTLDVATSNGLMGYQAHVDPSIWLVASEATGLLPFKEVASVVVSSEGTWILPADPDQPVMLMQQGQTTPVTGMPAVAVMAVDPSGTRWTNKGIWNGRGFDAMLDETGQPLTEIHTILNDGEAIWIGNSYKLVRFVEGQAVEAFDVKGRFDVLAWSLYQEGAVLAGGNQQFAMVDRQGNITEYPEVYGLVLAIDTVGEHIWVATVGDGLFHFDGSRWEHINRLDGLPRDGGVAILIDKQGTVWLGGDGLVSIRPQE
jgi:ligand-binding sensor domain-containing protein